MMITFANNYIEQPGICDGCSKWVTLTEGTGRCPVYRKPAIESYERRGGCPINQKTEAKAVKKVNPLKASKRGGKK